MKNLRNFKFFALIFFLSNLTGLAALDRVFDKLKSQLKAEVRAKTWLCTDCLMQTRSCNPFEIPLCSSHYEEFSLKYMRQQACLNRALAAEKEKRLVAAAGRQSLRVSQEPLPALSIACFDVGDEEACA